MKKVLDAFLSKLTVSHVINEEFIARRRKEIEAKRSTYKSQINFEYPDFSEEEIKARVISPYPDSESCYSVESSNDSVTNIEESKQRNMLRSQERISGNGVADHMGKVDLTVEKKVEGGTNAVAEIACSKIQQAIFGMREEENIPPAKMSFYKNIHVQQVIIMILKFMKFISCKIE